jgi:hypothetical protein
MTGEEEDAEFEIVQIGENVTNIVRGKVTGTVMQFEQIDGDISVGEGIVIRGRKPLED